MAQGIKTPIWKIKAVLAMAYFGVKYNTNVRFDDIALEVDGNRQLVQRILRKYNLHTMGFGRKHRDRYEINENGCWIWLLCINDDGYAQATVWIGGKGQNVYMHKYNYEQKFGLVPEGLELDHLCRNRRCINPDHLEAVTHAENVRRGNRWK